MKYKIDTTTWKRREHYEFFNGMDDPFWGTVVPVDFTECYLEAKKRRTSFFLCSLHRILTAVTVSYTHLTLPTSDLGAGAGRTDLIYFSAVPWFAFTEMKHARSANRGDSIPRISTGKLTRSGDRLTMPVSLDVHHGFIDGRQAGEFFALLENRE